MRLHEAELAAAGGVLGGVIAFVAWCLIISHQLKRSTVHSGFGE